MKWSIKLWLSYIVVFTMILSVFVIASTTTCSFAQDKGACRTIHHQEGRVYVIKSALYQTTHIRLPNKLMMDPVKGSELWTAEGDGHHIMVQPNSAEAQGKRTTLTLIDDKNVSYNFKLLRVKTNSPFDTCVTIKHEPKFFGKAKGESLSSYQTPEELAQKGLMNQIQSLQASLAQERQTSEKRIDDVLKKYRTFIYTRYKWNAGEGFKGSGLITDVYDDGRFTFIRVTPDNRGMLAVSAKIDGKKEMLEYTAESETLYRISGIYPRFDLKYGKSSVTVKRKDNSSNGVY